MKNDPSATHLGDIGTIFGGGPENQIAQSVKRLGSLSRIKPAADLSTQASSLIKKNSKLNMVVDKYVVQKPSSINLHSHRLNRKRNESKASLGNIDTVSVSVKNAESSSRKIKPMIGSTVRKNNLN